MPIEPRRGFRNWDGWIALFLPATFPAESLHRVPKAFRLSVPMKMFDEYLLRLGREIVGDVDRVGRSVERESADPLIDRLSDVEHEGQAGDLETEPSPSQCAFIAFVLIPRLLKRQASVGLGCLRPRHDGYGIHVLRERALASEPQPNLF